VSAAVPSVLTFELGLRARGFTLDCAGDVSAGVTALFGPSGSGKTTTLDCIAGVLRPDRGRVVLNGRTLFSSEMLTFRRAKAGIASLNPFIRGTTIVCVIFLFLPS